MLDLFSGKIVIIIILINKSSSKYLEENPAVQNDNSLVI